MEEGIFPHSRTVYAPHELEEERRLCYVAITRAKDRLIVTLAKWRTIFGSRQANIPSRFLYEIPEHLLSWEHPQLEHWDETVSYDE
jgi:DNA helicase-2/ATP-dependent DNA helicase PcrA